MIGVARRRLVPVLVWTLAAATAAVVLGGCSLLLGPLPSGPPEKTAYRSGAARITEFSGIPDGPPLDGYDLHDGYFGPVTSDSDDLIAGAVYETDSGWAIFVQDVTPGGLEGHATISAPDPDPGWGAPGNIGERCEAEVSDDFAVEFSGRVRCTDVEVHGGDQSGARVTFAIEFSARG